MSLSIDGVWKAGVWATTVWADGVWAEGGTPTPPPAAVVQTPIGGGIPYNNRRTKRDIARDRERFGIPDVEKQIAEALVEQIAARQAKTLEQDEHKRFEELQRELQLRGIEWQARYLEMMNAARERLIREEIAVHLQRIQDEETMLMLLALVV